MDRLTARQKQVFGYGFAGLVLIVAGLKFMLSGSLDRPTPIELNGVPAVLFFSLDEPCDCMKADVQGADEQIARWKERNQSAIPVFRIDFETRRDLAIQFNVRQTPGLLVVNSREEVVYRQNYPLFSQGSFDLAAVESQIQALDQAE